MQSSQFLLFFGSPLLLTAIPTYAFARRCASKLTNAQVLGIATLGAILPAFSMTFGRFGLVDASLLEKLFVLILLMSFWGTTIGGLVAYAAAGLAYRLSSDKRDEAKK